MYCKSPAARDLWVALQLAIHRLPSPACGGRCPKGGWGPSRCAPTTKGATETYPRRNPGAISARRLHWCHCLPG
ncbi:N5-glutamine S-adenosyl-L-methionine-dependent methyltransferase [Xanthomonas citri pv. glycines str. 8ra]|nr:N5-glutamine S-adenosyl-L-methionine-dependent methyltransferase [Xanthomonas citri pv. glycines str. 8ra]